MQTGDIPSFKIFDTPENIYYDAVPSENFPWFNLSTYIIDSLQNIKEHKHDCGRPGINGGFIKNKRARFGVNCYGHKPEITPEESDTLGNSPAYPLTRKEMRFNDRVSRFRKVLPEILVAPFNNNQWSQI